MLRQRLAPHAPPSRPPGRRVTTRSGTSPPALPRRVATAPPNPAKRPVSHTTVLSTVQAHPHPKLSWWLVHALVLGFYLTMRGYHSFDGDQAYRLPLLVHRQNPLIYADDPFVRAFDEFNPHRGALMVLDSVARPLGLSAGLFVLFILTFSVTCIGVESLTRSVWPELNSNVGLLAIVLVLVAKAGNIGTNHLFEAMVLDRLMAMALGWLALAKVVTDPHRHRWAAPGAICLATLIHPSVGLQIAMVLCVVGRLDTSEPLDRNPIPDRNSGKRRSGRGCGAWPGDQLAYWTVVGEQHAGRCVLAFKCRAARATAHAAAPVANATVAGLGVLPGARRAGMHIDEEEEDIGAGNSRQQRNRRRLPSHGWAPSRRARLVITLAVILAGLAVAWFFIEILRDARATVFQPFRMATFARGIALVLIAGRLMAFWKSRTWLGRLRAILLVVGFMGDWLLVVVTISELAVSIAGAVRSRVPWFKSWTFVDAGVLLVMIALGLNFLGHHDTEYGHIPLLLTFGVGLFIGFPAPAWHFGAHERSFLKRVLGTSQPQPVSHELPPPRHRPFGHPLGAGATGREPEASVFLEPLAFRTGWERATVRRLGGVLALAWFVPLAALFAAAIPWDHPWSRHPLVTSLLNRCRFIAVPIDDIERLAIWCQENTPPTARFIGPPGPKAFRLWSLRNLAFNRAASPYHAAGLADWFARFQDHVDFHGEPAEFVRAYVQDRHGFEARYQSQSDSQRAALAIRQGASHIIAAAPAAASVRTIRQGRTSRRTNVEAGSIAAAPSPYRDLLSPSPLELLHVEGRYAVYRIKSDALVQQKR